MACNHLFSRHWFRVHRVRSAFVILNVVIILLGGISLTRRSTQRSLRSDVLPEHFEAETHEDFSATSVPMPGNLSAKSAHVSDDLPSKSAAEQHALQPLVVIPGFGGPSKRRIEGWSEVKAILEFDVQLQSLIAGNVSRGALNKVLRRSVGKAWKHSVDKLASSSSVVPGEIQALRTANFTLIKSVEADTENPDRFGHAAVTIVIRAKVLSFRLLERMRAAEYLISQGISEVLTTVIKQHHPDLAGEVPLYKTEIDATEVDRLQVIADNLQKLSKTIEYDCLIYLHKLVDFDHDLLKPCRVIDTFAKTGGYMGTFLKAVSLQAVKSHSHVIVLLDDIDITEVELDKFMRIMNFNELDIASPIISGSAQSSMHDGAASAKFPVGRVVKTMEPQFTWFKPAAFECLQNMMDLERNPLGWGYDLMLNSVCKARMGMIDCVSSAQHKGTTQYDEDKAEDQMRRYLLHMKKQGHRAANPKSKPLGPLHAPPGGVECKRH